MPAVAEVRINHGAAPALGTDITGQTIRFKRADDDALDDADPVPRPAAGFAFSWRKSTRIVFTNPPDNKVFNLRFFSDGGSLGTGRRTLYARSAAYVQAGAADETTPISAVDVTSLTPASPDTIEPGVLIDSATALPAADSPGSQDFVMLQLEADSTAQGGSGGSLTMRFRYSET